MIDISRIVLALWLAKAIADVAPGIEAQLQALGFIGAEPRPWPGLDPVWRDDQIARLRREFRKDYLRVPRPSPSGHGGVP